MKEAVVSTQSTGGKNISVMSLRQVFVRPSFLAVRKHPIQLSSRRIGTSFPTFRPEDENDTPKYTVNWILKDGSLKSTKEKAGLHLLEIAHKNGIDLEGACDASLACSTCHVIVTDKDYYDMLPDPEDEENDMLDLAFGLTETSRLGCQVYLTPELDGLTVKLPAASRNFAVDGFVPKPH
eukprot:TRINITY_DN3568_c0_g2_i1.p1 TRINITY_DN3568_c0_g2~~TRINITY_DN3568_c0_g2_i1.p1  ORF type:complete len:180 (-),score=30.04 TRINITY_DN3568_c0_g2_i1:270-809(-)